VKGISVSGTSQSQTHTLTRPDTILKAYLGPETCVRIFVKSHMERKMFQRKDITGRANPTLFE